MDTQQQRVEVETLRSRDHHFAIEDGPRRELRSKRLLQLGKIAIERLQVTALNEQLDTVPEHQGAKTVPLGLEEPPVIGRQVAREPRQHRLNWRLHGQAKARDRLDHRDAGQVCRTRLQPDRCLVRRIRVMDYGLLIRDAWLTTWRNRLLWVLGLFAGVTIGTLGVGGSALPLPTLGQLQAWMPALVQLELAIAGGALLLAVISTIAR